MSAVPVTMTIEVDVSQFVAAIARAQEALAGMRVAAEKVGREMRTIAVRMERHRQVELAGREARYYVRGGLDPRFASREALDAEVQRMMSNQWWAWSGERGILAAALIRGWVEHRTA